MRLVIFGNSGAGKSTLARRYAEQHELVHLDLDTLAWLPGPKRAPIADSAAAIDAFVAANPAWVIEGCYADLLALVAPRCTRMLFLNPGVEVCIEHCRARPWEPHKYENKAAQDANLSMLIDWVRAYETRTDEFSLQAHRALFDGFTGNKLELTDSR